MTLFFIFYSPYSQLALLNLNPAAFITFERSADSVLVYACFPTADKAACPELETRELETSSSGVNKKLGALLSLVRGVDDKDEIVLFRSKKESDSVSSI